MRTNTRPFILAAILLAVILPGDQTPAQKPDPWLNGFPYRKAVTITGSSSGNQTDYQVKVTVSFATGKMKTDFSDIRFTASDGVTLLDYWRESYTASSNADFWVEVPSISTSGTMIYMYYGNPDGSSSSDAGETFLIF